MPQPESPMMTLDVPPPGKRASHLQSTRAITMTRRRAASIFRYALIALVLPFTTLGGCGPQQLIATPNLYASGAVPAFSELPPALQTDYVDVLFATDRGIEKTEDEALAYGAERSPSLAFGICRVKLGQGMSWDAIVADSRAARRQAGIPITVESITELGRLPASPYPREMGTDGPSIPLALREEIDRQVGAFQSELAALLRQSPRKEALIFVHGFNNSFEDAVIRAAELSHILGREFVPIMYSWPAGSGGGFLRGYQHDIESAEFTIYHFKEFLRAVADTPGLERIHILAHSRGNVMLTSAIREIFLEEGGVPRVADFRRRYKLHNVILAAADLDMEVAQQRVVAEGVGLGVERITIYICASDKALDLSSWLFQSVARLGQIQQKQFEAMSSKVQNRKALTIIDARVRDGLLTHSYFLDSPAVSSDLVLLIRFDREPGAEHGRPLTNATANFWSISPDYPKFGDTDAAQLDQ
ncbi:MAG: alpha/beta hydrolase [Phycisphaerae bacterium]|nr:alpha/beta hydrolase [Phycisphaerae bacterium]